MSMMVNPVSMSKVSFTNQTAATNVLERQGAFAKPTEATVAPDVADKPKKSGKKTALKVLTGALVVAAALATLNKTNVLKVLDDVALKDAKWFQKIGHYLSKAGECIAKYTYDPVANLCKKWFSKGNPAA